MAGTTRHHAALTLPNCCTLTIPGNPGPAFAVLPVLQSQAVNHAHEDSPDQTPSAVSPSTSVRNGLAGSDLRRMPALRALEAAEDNARAARPETTGGVT